MTLFILKDNFNRGLGGFVLAVLPIKYLKIHGLFEVNYFSHINKK
jgi:hypothetical protein